MPKVSVVIPTMKGREAMCARLISTIPKGYEIIVVGNDDLLLAAKRNHGAKLSTGEYLFFVDDDNYLAPGAIESAVRLCEESRVGVVGFMACYDDRKDFVADGGSMRNYLTGFTKGINTNAHWPDISKSPYQVDEVANAFMLHAELFFELQGFDEKNFPIDLDEADLCKKVKDKGYKILMNPMSLCYHKSITYSHIPDFRRPLNAYFHGRNRILFQGICNPRLRYLLYLVFFLPCFVGFYSASLLWRRKPRMLWHFNRGVLDGLFRRFKNPYQKRQVREGGSVPLR